MTTSVLGPLNLLSGEAATVPPVLTQVGVDVHDLGQSNGNTMAKDIVDLPGEVTGLNSTTGNIADAVYDTGSIDMYTSEFVASTSGNLSDAATQPLDTTANTFVMDFHHFLEGVGHVVGVPFTVHGVTNLGETIGLGHIGEGHNLITDTVGLVGCADGNGGSAASIPGDLQNIAGASTGPISGIVTDLGSGPDATNVLGPSGIVGGSGLDLGRVDDVLSQQNGPLDPASTLVGNVTHVLDHVGDGGSGGTSDIVTSALNVPGELLPDGGPTPSLTDLGHEISTTVGGAGDTIQSALAGDPTAQPVAGILDQIGGASGLLGGESCPVDGVVHSVDQVLSGGDPVSSIIGTGDGATNGLISDVGHDLGLGSGGGGSGGGSDPISGITSVLGNGDPVSSIIGTGDGATNGLISDVGHDLGLGSGGGGSGGGSDPISSILSHLPTGVDGGSPTGLLGGIADGGVGSVIHDGGLCVGNLGGVAGLPASSIGDVVASIASLGSGSGCMPLSILGGDTSASGSASGGADVHSGDTGASGGLLGSGSLDLSDVGAALHTSVAEIANANLDLDQLTNHVNLFDIGHCDLLSSVHHA